MQSGQTLHDPDTIPRARDHIRILKLFPGTFNADLEGNIIRQPIRSEHVRGSKREALVPYEALSYSWGPKAPNKHMKIVAESSSFHIEIRPNLDQALRHLRHPKEPRCLWVDAICINQRDEAEKSEQIPQMSWIYSRATSVAVWLGQESHGSAQAMEFVRRFLKLEEFDSLVRDSLTSKDWAALSELMRRPWFSRRWIIQEIAVAKAATLYCGKDSIPWREFADGISMFASKRDELRELFRESSAHSNHPDYLGELDGLGAIRLVYASDNLFRKNGKGTIVEHLFSLEALMSSMSAFEASDPHDILYAIVWLANDAHPVDRKAPFAQGLRPAHIRSTPLGSPILSNAYPFPTNGAVAVNGDDSSTDGNPNERLDSPIDSAEETQTCKNGVNVADTNNVGKMSGQMTEEPQSYDASDEMPPNKLARTSTSGSVQRQDSATQRKLEKYLAPMMERRMNRERLMNKSNTQSMLRVAGGMWKDAMTNRNIYVDYSKSVFEVCKDFLEFVFKRSQSIDMICRPWAPDDPDLPSWIPPLSRSAFAPGVRRVHRRVHADPLVGEPGNGLKPYRASSSRQAKWEISSSDGRTLTVGGFELDTIIKKSLPASAGIIPAEWMRVSGWDESCLPQDKFWRTLVGDRTKYGRRPPSHWQRICADAFQRRPKRGDLNTTETILYDCPSVVREFLERVQCVVWSRRLVLLQHLTDSLALVPPQAKKGDIICILDGCSVPVVLRRYVDGVAASKKVGSCEHPHCPTNRKGGTILNTSDLKIRLDGDEHTHSSSGEHFEFIGEAYVHGMMDGEAFGEMRRRGLRTRDFDLR